MSSQACTGEWPGRTGPGRQKMRGTRPRRGLRGQAGGGRPPRVRGSARPSAARLPQPRGAGEPQAGVGWRLERRRSRNLTPPRQSSPSPPLLKLLPAPRAASPAPIPRAGITGGQRAGEQVGVGERSRGPASRGVGARGAHGESQALLGTLPGATRPAYALPHGGRAWGRARPDWPNWRPAIGGDPGLRPSAAGGRARGSAARRVLPPGVSRASGWRRRPRGPALPSAARAARADGRRLPERAGCAWGWASRKVAALRAALGRRGSPRGPADSARRWELRTRDLRTASWGAHRAPAGSGGPLRTCRLHLGGGHTGDLRTVLQGRAGGRPPDLVFAGRVRKGEGEAWREGEASEGGREKEAAAARRRVIYTFKNQSPAPRREGRGASDRTRGTRAPHAPQRARPARLSASCASLSRGPRRPGARTPGSRSAARRHRPPWGVTVVLPPYPRSSARTFPRRAGAQRRLAASGCRCHGPRRAARARAPRSWRLERLRRTAATHVPRAAAL